MEKADKYRGEGGHDLPRLVEATNCRKTGENVKKKNAFHISDIFGGKKYMI